MKTKFLLTLTLLFSVLMFAQTEVVSTQTTSSKDVWDLIKVLILPGLLGQITVLVADAGKWIKAGEFKFPTFFSSKLKPFLLINLISVLIIVLYLFVPYFTVLFASFTGYEITALTSLTLYGAATAVIDGFLKKVV